MKTSPQPQHRIVVGIDGSDPSKAALAWAIRQARLTGVPIEAVTAWEYPLTYGYPMQLAPATTYEELAGQVLADVVGEADRRAEDIKITRSVTEGNAAQVLLDASDGADLLVVGSRGHGGFVEALLGSVGQHCVHHATCPVVVIRDSVS